MDVVDIGHGAPTIFRSWWKKHNIIYQEGDLSELENITHQFHNLFGTDVPNANIVYANGSTQVINAILFAISRLLNRKILVGYKRPVYMYMHEFLVNSRWIEITYDLNNKLDVEIVISPNNPDGKQLVHKSSAKYIIYDRAYNWPIYSPNYSLTNNEQNIISTYTVSKSIGMGGIRLGYAFVNDELLTKEIKRAIVLLSICPNSFGLKITKDIYTR